MCDLEGTRTGMPPAILASARTSEYDKDCLVSLSVVLPDLETEETIAMAKKISRFVRLASQEIESFLETLPPQERDKRINAAHAIATKPSPASRATAPRSAAEIRLATRSLEE
jgi:hypothetical protein